MKRIVATVAFFLWLTTSSFPQNFTDLASYCRAMIGASTSTLLARTKGLPRSDVEQVMKGITDPLSIRMIKEVIEFAYSRPANTDFDKMKTELLNMCLAKKIFAQSPAPADATQEQTDWCGNKDYVYSPDLQINGCTAVIQSGQWSGEGLASAFNNRGGAYNDKKDYDRAIADFDQAIRLDPKYAFAYKNRGTAYYGKNDYDRAFADFGQAIRLDPKYAAAYGDRGNLYDDKKDYDRAIADYDQAIRLDPYLAFAYTSRGDAYGGKKDCDRAIADYDQAIRLAPQYAYAYNGRGVAKLRCGDTAGGNADIAVARRLRDGRD
jgi:tetratricopeptide (TPR) repeat protein